MQKSVIVVRGAFNYDADAVSDETGIKCDDVTLTQQHFKDECDINVIVERFGVVPSVQSDVRAPVYGDFSEVTDFTSALYALTSARESFEAMPANIRARFNNDPASFVDFCSKDENYDEAKKLGLVFDNSASTTETATAVSELDPSNETVSVS